MRVAADRFVVGYSVGSGNCRRRMPEGPPDQSTRASAGRAHRRALGSPSTHRPDVIRRPKRRAGRRRSPARGSGRAASHDRGSKWHRKDATRDRVRARSSGLLAGRRHLRRAQFCDGRPEHRGERGSCPWHRGDRGTGAGGGGPATPTTDAHPDPPRRSRPGGRRPGRPPRSRGPVTGDPVRGDRTCPHRPRRGASHAPATTADRAGRSRGSRETCGGAGGRALRGARRRA